MSTENRLKDRYKANCTNWEKGSGVSRDPFFDVGYWLLDAL